MATKGQLDIEQEEGSKTASKSRSSTSSESSSTEEEERLRRLFQTCDRDGDGYIDSQDLAVICRQLGMEDAVDEIMHQLGADESGRISFDEFVRCRMQLINEIEQEHMRDGHMGGNTPGVPPLPPPRRPERMYIQLGSAGSQLRLHAAGGVVGERRVTDREVTSLYKLMEEHDDEALTRIIHISDTLQGQQGGSNFMEVANSLHLAALTSLRAEIIDLSNRLQQATSDRDLLEKQAAKVTSERLRQQRDADERLHEQALRYEERVTELHSVIAELRKKLDRHQINVIREEDEYEESEGQSNKSNDDVSCNENINVSQAPSLVDIGNDLNAELSRVVSELEDAIGETRKLSAEPADHQSELKVEEDKVSTTVTSETLQERSEQVCRDMEKMRLTLDCSPPYLPDVSVYENAITRLQEENATMQTAAAHRQAEVDTLHAQLTSTRDDHERLKRRTRELQARIQSLEATTSLNMSSNPSLHDSRTSTPTKHSLVNPTTGERTLTANSSADQGPVAKVAGLKKLKTGSTHDRQVLGSELSNYGVPNAKVAEHLVQNLQECCDVQEISATLAGPGNEMPEAKIRELEIEFERLTSKIDNLKSQNDLVCLTLEESKAHCDHLSVLIGKYESNNTALQIAMSYSDQSTEAYGVLTALLDTERRVLLANCRAAGLGHISNGGDGDEDDQEEMAAFLQRTHLSRKSAEHSAKQLLQRLDRACGIQLTGCPPNPWEELSSNSRTTSTTSSTASSADTEFSKVDEAKLRDYISQLHKDRAAVTITVQELESVHIDPLAQGPGANPDAQRLDLENAVLMQELMAMKEEKAELKAQNYLLETEKSALELQLSGKQSQEQAYVVQIEHFKSELKEQLQLQRTAPHSKKEDQETPAISLAELRSGRPGEMAADLSEALRREKRLKARVQELVLTVEKLSKNSDIRHQQSAEFVSELKRANSALVTAFEKAKKKYQAKVKKLEAQMQTIKERYEKQIHMLKQRVTLLEGENSRPPANETSL